MIVQRTERFVCCARKAIFSFVLHDPSGIGMKISSFAAFLRMCEFFNTIESFSLLKVNIFVMYDTRKNVVYTAHAFV